MIPTQSFRSVVPLVIGLAVGGLGVGLFQHSTPGMAGTPEAQIQHLETELQQARTRIAALEETRPRSSRSPAQTAYDRGREIAQRLREGRTVSSDDLFRAAQPLLRDMAPLFERIADQKSKQQADSLIGELARKYDLNPNQQESLQKWFSEKSRADRKKWNDLISSDDTTYMQWVKSMRNDRTDEGLDPVMEELLKGPQLEAFKPSVWRKGLSESSSTPTCRCNELTTSFNSTRRKRINSSASWPSRLRIMTRPSDSRGRPVRSHPPTSIRAMLLSQCCGRINWLNTRRLANDDSWKPRKR